MVEDDQASRKALHSILSRRGWDVSVAASLADARPLLETLPRVLILDLMLPDGDGTDLLQQVRQNEWPIKVVVTTGSSDSLRLTLVEQLNPDFLLLKPIDLDQLMQAVGPLD